MFIEWCSLSGDCLYGTGQTCRSQCWFLKIVRIAIHKNEELLMKNSAIYSCCKCHSFVEWWRSLSGDCLYSYLELYANTRIIGKPISIAYGSGTQSNCERGPRVGATVHTAREAKQTPNTWIRSQTQASARHQATTFDVTLMNGVWRPLPHHTVPSVLRSEIPASPYLI